MANNLNIVVLNGRLVKDSEVKSTKAGTSVARFTLAINKRIKRQDKWEDEVSFFDVVVWGKMAEVHHPYLKKGKFISLTGELHQSRWMNTETGKNNSKIEIFANSIEYLSFNKEENVNGSGSATEEKKIPVVPETTIPEPMPEDVEQELFDDSDVPF